MKNCLLLLNQRNFLVSFCAWSGIIFCASVLNAADTVPDEWNVAPMTAGAYLESFESGLPTWAGATGASVTTSDYPVIADLPTRSNTWFSTHSNVLALDTEGTIISNELQGTSGPVSFATEAVYVDMCVRFNPMTEEPDPAVLEDCKLGVFVNSEYKLVIAHSGGCSTNSTVLDTNDWFQITVEMTNGICNVYRNDQIVFSDITLNASGDANELNAVNFSGTGYLDDLYVSRCAPDYSVVGPVTEIPALPADGSNVPTDQQQTRINTYISEQSELTSIGMTQDELSQSYLVDASISGDPASAPTIDFGISDIEVINDTTLKVTASLDVASSAKGGNINGYIQLQGKTAKDGTWEDLGETVTPSFTSGEYTFTYTISSGYKFFRGQIIL
ncbi:MAG: hypothetical protein R6V06_03045 [Kiritimatiellia bacterium]